MVKGQKQASGFAGFELIEALPVAIYATDATGRVNFYNAAAADLWGHRPELGSAQWCGAWRLFWPDGRPMPHDQSPMALALKQGRPVPGLEAIVERPDGTRVPFTSNPKLLRDQAGRVTGAINLLVDMSDRRQGDIASAKLAAIVASSHDAIISKTLDGIITSWNDGATRIFGYLPEEMIGESIRKIIPADLQAEEDEILARLKKGERIDHFETVRIGKSGRRIALSITVSPIRDSFDVLVGASKVARDISERKEAEATSARLAAIVSSSDDAIISKSLEGIVRTWNSAASRIFGYAPEEIIGQSIKKIVPPELQQEEDKILARLKQGERIEHFDTVRIARDGRLIHVSLAISPIHDGTGAVIGASKVARDITERKHGEELQRLLFDELNHRVKNTLAIIQAIASQSMRTTSSPGEFVTSFNGRVHALARAHDLLVEQRMKGARVMDLVREQVLLGSADERVTCEGPEVVLDARVAVQLALVFHELATNARKYGALSVPAGALSILWNIDLSHGRVMHLKWRESGVPSVRAPPFRGFGTTLIERSLEANQGEATLRFGADGVTCEIRLSLPEQSHNPLRLAMSEEAKETWARQALGSELGGKRILVVEDEPLIALQIEWELMSGGFQVVGPASHIESAKHLIANERFDFALLDANLGGHSVEELAWSLRQKSVPFAFATGYGREALPAAFRDAEVIAKPIDPDRLVAFIQELLSRRKEDPGVVPLRPRKG